MDSSPAGPRERPSVTLVRKSIGVAMAIFGLLVSLSALYVWFAGFIRSAVEPLDPEKLAVPPGIIAVAAVLCVVFGYLIARPASVGLRAAFVVALVPTAIIGGLLVRGALLTLAEPLFRTSRTMTLTVNWTEYDSAPGQVVVLKPPDVQWITLDRQPGLLEHLRSVGNVPVEIRVRVLNDRYGLVTRVYPEELAGYRLRHQSVVGGFSEFRLPPPPLPSP